MIELKISGCPVPWAAPGRRGKVYFNPRHIQKEQAQWQIRSQWREKPIPTSVHVELLYFLPIPADTSNIRRRQMINRHIVHRTKPDLDNLCKFALDCIKGIVIEDDNQVFSINAQKWYGTEPQTILKIFPLTNEGDTYANEKGLKQKSNGRENADAPA